MTISKETVKRFIDNIEIRGYNSFFAQIFKGIFPYKNTGYNKSQLSQETIRALERESGFSTADEKQFLIPEWSEKHGLVFAGSLNASESHKATVGIPSHKEYYLDFVIDARTRVIISTRDIAEV